ncbi:MAG: hypothetical protein PVI89_12545 [Desulfobacteraceae bacterium]|jgi:hypothetical protein
MAADFELFWDHNCDADATLEGYYIYYNKDASVVGNSSGATKVYVSASANGFDRTAPSYQISNLLDDVRYCFAVTAWYGDEESDLSNEVCGAKSDAYSQSVSEPEPEPEPDPEPDDANQIIIIDNGQSGTASIGMWHNSGGADPYGNNSLYSKDNSAEYTYESTLNGSYEVAIWWTPFASRCSAVPVEIFDGDVLLDTVTVDQTQNGGQWNVLGTYDFSGSATVVVISDTDNCSTCADAVQFQN